MKNRNAATTGRLWELERAIGRDLRSAQKVNEALEEIRDNRLYLKSYATFAEYCQKRLGIGRRTKTQAHRRFSRSPKNEAATAYHEAGHAVMKSCLGLGYSGISIVSDNDSWGRVESSGPEKPSTNNAIEMGARWHRSRFRAEKWVMVLQAGDVAQRHYDLPSVGLYYSRSDFERCKALLLNYDPDKGTPDIDLYYDLLQRWTDYLIEEQWHSVEALAKALREHKKLSGAQVREVIRDAKAKQVSVTLKATIKKR